MEKANPQRLDWLDYVRFFCAISVMLAHYLFVALDPQIVRNISNYGLATDVGRYAVVPLFIFLMMSGLVIAYVAERQSAATFITHRAARIYPTFFVCMTTTALVANFGPPVLHVSLAKYAANLPINAPLFGYKFVDAVYWTLVIEIIFYGAVLVAIFTGAIRHLQTLVTAWIILQVICVVFPARLPLFGADYSFFAAGFVFALLYQRRNEKLNFMLLAISAMLCLRTVVQNARAYQADPWISCAITVAFFALFLAMRGRSIKLPMARRIGSMTYPLYLLHFKIGLVVMSLTITDANKWWVSMGLAAAMIGIGFIIDDIMEFRLRPLWTALMRATIARPFIWWENRKQPA